MLVYSASARKDIRALDPMITKRLGRKLEEIRDSGKPLIFARRLEESAAGSYRFRIGPYRAGFDVKGRRLIILRVRHRSVFYR